MKQKIFTILLIAAAGLSACKKDTVDQNIKEYDETQIQNYIAANSLTGFSRDTEGGDTTGMYYKIINKGTGPALEYSDKISFVYTLKSFDGKYTSSDTILNHFNEYVGHIEQANLPKGLQIAIHNLLKYRDGSMRVLIPSRLAYGQRGFGTGSISNANSRIAGNQSLDYYIHVINDQQVYDDLVIRNYMTANNLTGYTKTASGLYYKVITPGTGTIGEIGPLSTVTTTYTGALLNGTFFDKSAETTAATFSPTGSNLQNSFGTGVYEGLTGHAAKGTSISLLVPSRLAYGAAGLSTAGIPVYAPVRFEFQITDVTN